MCDLAKECIEKAELKLEGEKSFFSWLGLSQSSSAIKENAAQLYIKAGNHYKMGKFYVEAADCYYKAYLLYNQIKSKTACTHYLVSNLTESAECYVKSYKGGEKKVGEKALDFYNQSIEILIDEGNYGGLGKYVKRLAEIYEEFDYYSEAVSTYIRAADNFENNNNINYCRNCISKAGELSARKGDFNFAIELFEKLKNSYNGQEKDAIVKYYLIKCYLDIMICYLACGDMVASKKTQEKYFSLPGFAKLDEYKFVDSLLYLMDRYDSQGINLKLNSYSSLISLKDWHVSAINNIIKVLEQEDGSKI